jgi:hypothetical protein
MKKTASKFERAKWRLARPPARLVVEFPELPKGENPENSAKVNPEWVSAPYECIFYVGPGVHIGPPPKIFKKSGCQKSKPVIYSRAYGKENKTSVN